MGSIGKNGAVLSQEQARMLCKMTPLITLVLLPSVLFPSTEIPLEKMEFELVWEEVFDKKIKDVAWGETEDGRLYPKIILFADEIRFYDEEANLLWGWQEEASHNLLSLSVQFSPKSNHITLSSKSKPPVSHEKWADMKWPVTTKTRILNSQGEEVWKQVYTSEDDTVGVAYVSDPGFFVLVDQAYAYLAFYGPNGNLLRQVKPFGNMDWDNGRQIRGIFTDDGKHFVCFATRHGANIGTKERQGKSAEPFVIMFTNRGEELWRYPLPGMVSDQFQITPDGSFIGCSTWEVDFSIGSIGAVRGVTHLLDRTGSLVSEYPFRSFRIAFSPDGEYGVLIQRISPLEEGEPMTPEDRPAFALLLIQTQDGEVIWKETLRDSKSIPFITLSTEANFIVAHTDGKTRILDKRGRCVGEKSWVDENMYPKRMRILSDASIRLLAGGKLFRLVKIEK